MNEVAKCGKNILYHITSRLYVEALKKDKNDYSEDVEHSGRELNFGSSESQECVLTGPGGCTSPYDLLHVSLFVAHIISFYKGGTYCYCKTNWENYRRIC
jgi:hypothetical protein